MTSNDLLGKTLEIAKRRKTGVTAAMVSMMITTDVEDHEAHAKGVEYFVMFDFPIWAIFQRGQFLKNSLCKTAHCPCFHKKRSTVQIHVEVA